MSAVNETLLISLSSSLAHLSLDVQKMDSLSFDLSKTLLGILLEMQRLMKSQELSGGESSFDLNQVRAICQSSQSSSMKIMLITSDLYVAWPYVKEGVLSIQEKLAMSTSICAQLKLSYGRVRALGDGDERLILETEINILLAKLNETIKQARESGLRLLKDLEDGFEILKIILGFHQIGERFTKVNMDYKELSLQSIEMYKSLKALHLPELKLLL